MATLQLLAAVAGTLALGIASAVQKPLIHSDQLSVHNHEGKVQFTLQNKEHSAALSGELGLSLSENLEGPQFCDDGQENCLQFQQSVRLTTDQQGHCHKFNWVGHGNVTIQDCMDYGGASWFGGPENVRQYWPFNNMTFTNYSYITKMADNTAVAERYWLSSTGFYIFVDKSVPLFISADKKRLCLMAKQAPPYLPRGDTQLSYRICSYRDARAAHTAAIRQDLGHPTGIPDTRMVEHPIWSTWVRFKWDVNETAVRAFAKEIIDNGFNNSQIEIDDNWETCYGSAEFNKSRFPDMPRLGADLHDMGFRVTLWNHPFINTNCQAYKSANEKDFLVKDQAGNTASVWWDGNAGAIDFTNPEAVRWYLERHRATMKHNNIDNLKQDAGESSWLPQIPVLNASAWDQPNAYSEAYVRTVAQFGGMVEVRVGHRSQDLPIFVRMLDKDSKWNFENGLPTLITTLFQLTLSGYSLILPDMVGGNAYDKDVVTKEMFLRWLQANTFMQSIQFSAAPWDFDQETIDISKKYTSLHFEYSDEIVSLMEECAKTGSPINTPIWWVAPRDKVALSIWNEYMLGENILVAPVVEKGAVTRDIYLPRGHWREEAYPKQKLFHGPVWLRDYPAPLDILPYFTRVSSAAEDLMQEQE